MERFMLRPVTWDNARLGAYTTIARYRHVKSMKHVAAKYLTARLSKRASRYLYKISRMISSILEWMISFIKPTVCYKFYLFSNI